MFTRTASDDVEFEIDAYELRKIFNSVYVKGRPHHLTG